VRCDRCDQRGMVPHHLSPIFWRFWNREQLATLVEQMREGERLYWLAHKLVKLQGPDGEPYMRETDGAWAVEVANRSE